MKKVCPICQKENHCDVQNMSRCWCMTITIPKELLTKLAKESQEESYICQQCILDYRQLNNQ